MVIEVALQLQLARRRATAQGEAIERPGDESPIRDESVDGASPRYDRASKHTSPAARGNKNACDELARTFRCGPSKVRS